MAVCQRKSHPKVLSKSDKQGPNRCVSLMCLSPGSRGRNFWQLVFHGRVALFLREAWSFLYSKSEQIRSLFLVFCHLMSVFDVVRGDLSAALSRESTHHETVISSWCRLDIITRSERTNWRVTEHYGKCCWEILLHFSITLSLSSVYLITSVSKTCTHIWVSADTHTQPSAVKANCPGSCSGPIDCIWGSRERAR